MGVFAHKVLPAVGLVGALALAGPALAGGPAQTTDRVGVGQDSHSSTWRRHHPGPSSGVDRGPYALPIPEALRGPTTVSRRVDWQVAPGVRYTRWDQSNARGPIRAYLLAVDPSQPGVALDYASTGPVRHTARVIDILARDHAVGGVNGDFYDIGHTGAPLGLGLGQDRQRGVLHGRDSGWNDAFYLDRHGVPQIGDVSLVARITQHPELTITNLNSPFVKPGGIGVYTNRWGRTAGPEITDGHKKHVRVVNVRGGIVRSSSTRLTHGKRIKGMLLVGRGQGARALHRLRKGSKVTLKQHLSHRPRMAISGSHFLVDDGVIKANNDTIQAPRTAVGIDRDTGEVLILVVDGRQKSSRGYTMMELADLMIDLGADEALNLDGGGSSTLVATSPGESPAVRNNPSDGFQRSVSNALEVTYAAPK